MLKLNKAWLYVLALLCLMGTTLIVIDTYALFETNGEATSSLEIGAWKILVNGNDVALNENITLNNFNYVNGTHTQAGYFAPGSVATFDIIIDAHESDVSVLYEFEIDDSPIEDYPNITFSVKNMNTNEIVSGNSYDGVIALTDQNRVLTLRVTLTWTDNVQYDESDSSLIGEELAFSMNAHFTQYTGE